MHPVAWKDRVPERTPHAGDAALVGREGHVAGGRAADKRHRAVHVAGKTATQDAERAGLSVDEADSDGNAGRQAQAGGDGLRHPAVPVADR